MNSTWLVLEKKISSRMEVFPIILIISFDIIIPTIKWYVYSYFIKRLRYVEIYLADSYLIRALLFLQL